MTIGSGVPYNEHTGNAVTTTFSYGFTLLDEGDLVVTIDSVATSAYTVTGIGDANGGTVVFDVAPASLAAILLRRVIALVRATEYQSNGDLQADTINDDFDRPWMAIQELSAQIGGTMRAPYPEQFDELPAVADRLGKQLLFHPTTGQPYLAAPVSGTAADVLVQLADDSGSSLVTFDPGWTGSAPAILQARLRNVIELIDADVDVYDGTARHVEVQAALDYCNSFTKAKSLSVRRPTLLGQPVYIDRLVDTKDSRLVIDGHGEGGFYTEGAVTMFDSTLDYVGGIHPPCELITFKDLHFDTSSVFNESFVMSPKFLRTRFDNAFFWRIRCMDPTACSFIASTATNKLTVTSVTKGKLAAGLTVRAGSGVADSTYILSQDSGTAGGAGVYTLSTSPGTVASQAMIGMTYAQTLHFDHCEFRNWLGRSIDCAGSYDLQFTAPVVESGYTLLRSVDAARGTNNFRIFGGVVQGAQASSVIATGATAQLIGVHVENNQTNDFDFAGGSMANPALTIIGTYGANPSGPAVRLGTTTVLFSGGNSVNGQMYTGMAGVTRVMSLDSAGTLADVALTTSVGGIKTKGSITRTHIPATYAATTSLDALAGNVHTITPTNSTPFTVTAGGAVEVGHELEVTIKNTTGGALGTVTWDPSVFKVAAYTPPADGFQTTTLHTYNGLHYKQSAPAVTVAN